MSRKSFPTITKVKVKNFRSIAKATIDLAPLTVFVGQNGAGKSNIIDVLRFTRDALTHGSEQAIFERHGMSALKRWSPKGHNVDIDIELSISASHWYGTYGFCIASEPRGKYRIKREICSITTAQNSDSYEISDGKIIQVDLQGSPSAAWLEQPLPLNALFLSSIPIGNFYLIHDTIKNMGFYTIYPDLLREPQKPSNTSPLDEKGQNLASVLREMKRSNEPSAAVISEALGKVIHGIHDFSVSQVGGYFIVRLHHGKVEAALALDQESDGTLRMLGILTALYQIPSRTLLAIEEPELTIHPGALGVLCDSIKEASSFSQIMITTHSPDLMVHFTPESLRIVENPSGETFVGPLVSFQREAIAQNLFTAGELMRLEGLHREPLPINSPQ